MPIEEGLNVKTENSSVEAHHQGGIASKIIKVGSFYTWSVSKE